MAPIGDNQVRMANICAYTAKQHQRRVRPHSEIIKDSVFHDYYLFKPKAFVKNGPTALLTVSWLGWPPTPDASKLLDDYRHWQARCF